MAKKNIKTGIILEKSKKAIDRGIRKETSDFDRNPGYGEVEYVKPVKGSVSPTFKKFS